MHRGYTSRPPMADNDRPRPSPAIVAIAAWLIPGAGYWLIGHRARGLTVGVTIIILFMSGILIGGVRSIQVPGYGDNGGRLYIVQVNERRRASEEKNEAVFQVVEQKVGAPEPSNAWVVTDFRALLADIGNKPW